MNRGGLNIAESGELAAGIIHDLNNILASISHCAVLMRERAGRENPLTRDLEAIRSLALKGSDLVKTLPIYSLPGGVELKPVNVNRVIEETLWVVKGIAEEKVTIISELEPALSPVAGDEVGISRIMMNLCLNAREAMPAGGTLRVKTAECSLDESYCRTSFLNQAKRYVRITVSDNGVGIEDKVLPHIFEPAFSTKGQNPGRGWGLSIVKEIVDQHEGWVEVESAPGEGTTFTLFLPAFAGEESELPSEYEGELQGGEETILIADDEEGFREGIGGWLQKFGYRVLEASSGEEVLSVLKERKEEINLILLDTVMNAEGGLELLRKVKEIAWDIPIVICTGYSRHDDHCRRMLEEGACDYIQKPFDSGDLIHKIRVNIERRFSDNSNLKIRRI